MTRMPSQYLASIGSSPNSVSRSSCVVTRESSQPYGRCTFFAKRTRPRGLSFTRSGNGDGGIETRGLALHVGEVLALHERPARRPSDGESLEIPGDVLAQVVHGHALVTVIEFGEQPGVAHDHAAHVTQRRVDALVAAREGVPDIGEQPWRPWQPRPMATPAHPVSGPSPGHRRRPRYRRCRTPECPARRPVRLCGSSPNGRHSIRRWYARAE